MVSFCLGNDIAIKNKDLYAFFERKDDVIVLKVFNSSILTFASDGWMQGDFTEAGKASLNLTPQTEHELGGSIYFLVLTAFWLVWQVESNQLKSVKTSLQFYTSYKIKPMGIKMKKWSATGELAFSERNGKITILCNGLDKKQYTVPSSQYPLPTNGPYSYWYHANAEALDDDGELSLILAGFHGELGRCYTNAEAVINKLSACGYTDRHKVEYYSGWLFGTDIPCGTHHAWVVIDDHSVIDLTMRKHSKLSEYREKCAEGIFMPFNRAIFASWIHEEQKSTAPFAENYYYGNVEKLFYIGTITDKTTATSSFRTLRDKMPNHPDYQNVNRQNGSNLLQETYYSQYE